MRRGPEGASRRAVTGPPIPKMSLAEKPVPAPMGDASAVPWNFPARWRRTAARGLTSAVTATSAPVCDELPRRAGPALAS